MSMVYEGMYTETKSLQDYISILKYRWMHMLIPATLIFLIILFVAYRLPAMYRSTATILIEEQEIPKDLVRSTITSYAAQQVQVIGRRIMTVESVSQIVEKYDLYQQRDGARLPSTELVQRFGNDMAMDLISADVIDPRSGRPTEATIAFTLSFENTDPVKAQKVANELVTFYLNENLRSRANKAKSATEFLATESEMLNAELIQIEEALASFKQQNEGSLPELYQYNLSVLDRTERDLSSALQRASELKKMRIALEAERAKIDPIGAALSVENKMPGTEGRVGLKVLKAVYRDKQSIYKDNHPDMVRLLRQIKALEDSSEGDQTEVWESDNPAYVYVDTQIKSIDAEASTLTTTIQKLQEKIKKYDELILVAPRVEKEYQSLLRNYNSAQEKFQEVKSKQRQALLAENLEQERKGERFSLVEPPSLPLVPVSPNRSAIMLLGFILATVFGFGLGVFLEVFDTSVKSYKGLSAVLSVPVMGAIPYLENRLWIKEKKQRNMRWILVILFGIVLGVGLVHVMIRPLDVIWYVLLQKMGLS